MKIDSVTIIGGGASLQQGIDLGLYAKIKNKCTITINYEYKYFDSTIICFSDTGFYNKNKDNLKNYPLIVGVDRNCGLEKLSNTYLFKLLDSWHNPLDIRAGLYACNLSGYLAMSFAIWVLGGIGKIFILGYDWTVRTESEKKLGIKNNGYHNSTPIDKRIQTHCHTKIDHKGIGLTSYFENNDPNEKFLPFLNEKEIQIYNVSPYSNITCFEKCDYPKFFKLIERNKTYSQIRLQNEIKLRLLEDLNKEA